MSDCGGYYPDGKMVVRTTDLDHAIRIIEILKRHNKSMRSLNCMQPRYPILPLDDNYLNNLEMLIKRIAKEKE